MRNYICLGFLSFLSAAFSLEAVSLRLENETTQPLTARIFAADGTVLGEELVPARQMIQWSEGRNRAGYPAQGPSTSIVPLKVYWYCESGEVFCMSTDEASGARVRTSACSGTKHCTEKK
jgi:hypothetical protein